MALRIIKRKFLHWSNIHYIIDPSLNSEVKVFTYENDYIKISALEMLYIKQDSNSDIAIIEEVFKTCLTSIIIKLINILTLYTVRSFL